MRTFRFLITALVITCLLGCSDDDDSSSETPDPFEQEVNQLRATVENKNSFEDAYTAGYQTLAMSDIHPDGFFAGMGYHFLNTDLLDDKFDPANPEAMLVYCNASGEYEIVGVEYIVTGTSPEDCPSGENCVPEGFTGATDVWKWNTEFGVWTLHAWPKWENADGFFAPMNKAIPEAKECDAPDLP